MLLRLINKSVVQPKWVNSLCGLTHVRTVTYIDRKQLPHPMPFDGPERDVVNFPRPTKYDWPPPVRFLFIPDSWFQAMYPKLGATGCYTLLFGTILFAVQKEHFLLTTPHWHHLKAVMIWLYIGYVTSLGKDLHWAQTKYDCEPVWNLVDDNWNDFKKWHRDAVEHEKQAQFQAEGEKMIFVVKRDNIAMQLEAAYRERAMKVYNTVKRRLDYQVEVTNILERVQRRFMLEWVLNKVKEAITPEKEKEALKKCISDLQLLAAKV